MTRSGLNKVMDRILVQIADANGFDITGTGISSGVQMTNALGALALEALADQIVAAGTSGNRVKPAVPPTVVRVESEQDAA